MFPTYPGQFQLLDILRLGDGPPVTVTSVGPAAGAGPQSRPQPLDVRYVVPEKDVVRGGGPGRVLDGDDLDVAGEAEEAVAGPGPGEGGEAGGGEGSPQEEGPALGLGGTRGFHHHLAFITVVQLAQQTDNTTSSRLSPLSPYLDICSLSSDLGFFPSMGLDPVISSASSSNLSMSSIWSGC